MVQFYSKIIQMPDSSKKKELQFSYQFIFILKIIILE